MSAECRAPQDRPAPAPRYRVRQANRAAGHHATFYDVLAEFHGEASQVTAQARAAVCRPLIHQWVTPPTAPLSAKTGPTFKKSRTNLSV